MAARSGPAQEGCHQSQAEEEMVEIPGRLVEMAVMALAPVCVMVAAPTATIHRCAAAMGGQDRVA